MSLLGTNRKLNREAAHNERKPASSAYRKPTRPAGPRDARRSGTRRDASRAGPPKSRKAGPETRKGTGVARNAAQKPQPPPRRRKGPQGGGPPCGPSRRARRAAPRAHIEKRPPRARRPALPQPRAAVLSAKAGLTAGFGMGPGDPRLCGRARGGRSPAAHVWSLPGTPLRGDPGGRMAGTGEDGASRSVL